MSFDFATDTSSLIRRAYAFADEAHHGQVRKYTGEPYVTHVARVARIVASHNGTDEMIAAALLHDVIEDTSATYHDVRRAFGWRVSNLVWWLTDVSAPAMGNRATRKEIDRQHLARAPASAQTIKLADLIDNATDICAHDPNFARVFLREKALLLDVLKRGNPVLMQVARSIVTIETERLQHDTPKH